jgi:hypothetical protein
MVILAGCGQQRQFKAVDQICLPQGDKALAMRTAEEVLGRMHFDIAKSDAQLGIIRTRPLAGAQFFEFWRKDTVGCKNQLQSNLHSIRRTVELNINRHADALCIDCCVNAERLNLPARPITSSARMNRMFTKSSSSKQGLKLDPELRKRMTWLDLGRDPELETLILNQIKQQMLDQQKGTKR